jgi:hypothetical protein
MLTEETKVISEDITYNPAQVQMLQYTLAYPHIRAWYAFGGVRSGKSLLICKAAQLIAQKFPGSRVLIARDTRVNLKNTTLATFFGYDKRGKPVIFRELFQPAAYNKTEGILTWDNGSVTCFWGMDNPEDIERVKSTEWSAIFLEEANGINIEVIRFLLETRLSHPQGPHKMGLISNSDTGYTDLYQLFHTEHNCSDEEPCENCMGPCEFRRIPCTTIQNFQNLPEDYVTRIKRLEHTNPEYYRVYVLGEFKEYTKKIFPEFNPLLHVADIPPLWAPPNGTRILYGYDHGYSGAPTALVTVYLLPDGSFLFWDEYYEQGKTVSMMADDFRRSDISFIHAADPSIRNKTQYRENYDELGSVQDLYRTEGITMELGNNDVSTGIEKIKNLLIPIPDHPHPINTEITNAPRFFIARKGGQNACPNLTRQMHKYRNKQDSRGNVNQKQWVPVKEDDHALDAARYVVCSDDVSDVYNAFEFPMFTVGWVKNCMAKKRDFEAGIDVELSEAM